MSDQDKHLLNQLQSGQSGAYEQLFKKYYKLLSTQAYYLLGDEMEAEDLVQETFIKLWHKKLYLTINTSIKAYLQRTVHNSCLNIIEKRKTKQRKLDAYLTSHNTVTNTGLFEKEESAGTVHSLLKTLPVQQGKAFNLVYFEDKKYKDAAEEMGISINSIKTHLKLALKHLREKMKSR